MGNDCLASTPIEHYSTWFFKGGSYFENLEVSELKDHWTTYKTYKIKKIYDKASTQHPQYPKHTHLDYENFVALFYEFKDIEEVFFFISQDLQEKNL